MAAPSPLLTIVALDGRVCAELAWVRQTALDRARRDGGHVSDRTMAALDAIVGLGRVERQRAGDRVAACSADGTSGIPSETPPDFLTTVQAAAQLGITTRAVTARITRKTLPARRAHPKGPWLVDPLAVADLLPKGPRREAQARNLA